MGHVQDTPVSTSMISNVCMVCDMKVHIYSYNLDQKKFPKSKIHTLPNYEQTDLKTAIVEGPKTDILPRKYFPSSGMRHSQKAKIRSKMEQNLDQFLNEFLHFEVALTSEDVHRSWPADR